MDEIMDGIHLINSLKDDMMLMRNSVEVTMICGMKKLCS